MNLIEDYWIPIRRASGQEDQIAPWQILESFSEDPVLSLDFPRADLNGSVIQFLIGLLQTTSTLDDENWEDWFFEPPEADELKKRFSRQKDWFEFSSSEPRFMQDYDAQMKGTQIPVKGLFIESPGENTIELNKDHFVKRDRIESLCESCTASVLLTLQTSAPAGGVGNRTGLRGGGPLTTLVQVERLNPGDEGDRLSLFQNLWLNVLDEESWESLYPANTHSSTDIYPWAKATLTSEKQQTVTPQEVSPLSLFWSTPRRIRINFNDRVSGDCSLCGTNSDDLIRSYTQKNYGANYTSWIHPLSPYYRKIEEWLPLHPQPGGIGYRNWLDLFSYNDTQRQASVLNRFKKLDISFIRRLHRVSLWSFGYDMDNMKARCWYESRMPVFVLENRGLEVILSDFAEKMINASKEVVSMLVQSIKNCWFKRPRDARGDTGFIDRAFWAETEQDFFLKLEQCSRVLEAENDLVSVNQQVMEGWREVLQKNALALFSKWAESSNFEHEDPKRTAMAYNKLVGRLNGPKLREKILGLPKPVKNKQREAELAT